MSNQQRPSGSDPARTDPAWADTGIHPARLARPVVKALVLWPLLVFAAFALASLVLLYFKERSFDRSLSRETAEQANEIADWLGEKVAGRMALVQALRDHFQLERVHAPAAALDGLGADLVRGLGGLEALAWISPEGEFQRVSPLESHFKALGANIRQDPEAGPFFEKAVHERSDQITPAVRLAQGGWGFFAFLPVVEDGKVRGVLAGIFRFQNLIDLSLRHSVSLRYGVVWRDDRRVYYEGWRGSGGGTEDFAGRAELRLAGHRYRIEVLPATWLLSEAAADRNARLALGLTFALVAALATRFALRRALPREEIADAGAGPTPVPASLSAEEAWHRSEESYRRFFDEAPFGHLVADEAGVIRLANRAALGLLDGRPAEVVGQPLIDVFGVGRDSRVAAARLLDRVERGEEIREEEVLLQRLGSRRRFWCSVSVQPLLGPTGEFVGSRFVLLDTSQRRSLEDRLRQSAKMEAVGRLAGGISHDFNNLLTAILGFARLGMSRLDPATPLARDLQEIEKAGRRAAALIAQLLAFARQHGGVAGVVEVETLVRDLAPMLRRLVREDIDLELDLRGAGSVSIDPAQLEQVIVNLVVNGMEAIAGVGRIDLVTEAAADPATGEPQAVLAVRDDGAGMAPEVQERIFEPFFSTKQHLSGTGLGLATVYGVIEQAGGTIVVDSEVGRGTTITVRLPQVAAAMPRTEAEAVPEALTPERKGGRERILLVEDEDLVRDMAQEMLQTLGYSVITARDGQDALDKVAGIEQEIDLLLSDVVMPRLGGDELYRRLRVLHPGVKVLFTSGYTDNAFIRQAVEKGEVPLLHKPYTLDGLALALRKLLG